MFSTRLRPTDVPQEERDIFYTTSNQKYGERWLSAQEEIEHPVKADTIPVYPEIGD